MSSGTPELLPCPHCGADVPPGAYCGNCGAHRGGDSSHHRRRTWAFAASPGEHVVHLSVISTLFPHLPRRHAHLYRTALAAGVTAIVLLASLQLFAAATLTAALVLPVLYLLYLYDVAVYEREPVRVLATTFGIGAVLGGLATWLLPKLTAVHSLGGPTTGSVLAGAVLNPVADQLLMLAGPLLLIRRKRFQHTLDGLAFGVTSAVGYAAAATVVLFIPVIIATPLPASPLDWALRIVRTGVMVVIVNAALTGTVTGALWSRHGATPAAAHRRWPVVLVIALLAQAVLGAIGAYLDDLLQEFVLWTVAAAAALLWLRLLIHHALLDDSADAAVAGPDTVCHECHHIVPAMRFCPHCGVHRAAAPKHGRTQTAAAEAPA